MGANPFQGPLKRWALKIETFLGPEMAATETHVHKMKKITCFYMALGLNDFDGGKSITRAIGRAGPLYWICPHQNPAPYKQ
jgi:hypothetical protein